MNEKIPPWISSCLKQLSHQLTAYVDSTLYDYQAILLVSCVLVHSKVRHSWLVIEKFHELPP